MGKPGSHQKTAIYRNVTVVILTGMITTGAIGAAVAAASPESDSPQSRPSQPRAELPGPVPEAGAGIPERADRGGQRTPVRAAPLPEDMEYDDSDSDSDERRPQRKEARHKSSDRVLDKGSCQASYYWEGERTASGARFDPDGLTAAHRTLPLGSRVRVTNKATGKSAVVRINDRGPFVEGRCLDLSRGAMRKVGGISAGVAKVTYEVLSRH